jgi:hypothetical protein
VSPGGDYRTVFDITVAGYKSWTFPAFGLAFVAAGAVLVSLRRRLPGWWPKDPRPRDVFAFAYLGFALLWTATTFLVTYSEYVRLRRAVENGRTDVVEGVVSQFKPMPPTDKGMERFCVQKECFEYSNNVVTAGFNDTSLHGGPIREGLAVRVTYVGNEIVKLEVGR